MAPPQLLSAVALEQPRGFMCQPAARRTLVDLEFNNLTYNVHRGKKTILHGVSGQFRAGELSAIMGTSGAGKSSLMDILVGYKSTGVTGSIRVNGRSRDLSSFHKLSSYIQQDDLVQPHLSVIESMNIAASLKLPLSMPQQVRDDRIQEILSTLGLSGCVNTSCERLSGGQRKRLCIALELVSNPPVLFLDEPTTGLDVVSVSQCVNLLRSLAIHQGRTIVCTLHQPSAALLSQFHHIYMLSEGKCVYQGSPQQLVPFLASIDRPCLPYNNPVDHVLELTHGVSRKETISLMCGSIQNGKLSFRDVLHTSSRTHPDLRDELKGGEFATPAMHQFTVLLHRAFVQASRNKAALRLQFLHHLLTSIILGGLFLNVGQDASQAYTNVKFCISLMVFFMYTHVMTPILLFPAEVKLLKREYFNRWYGLKPYFMAMSIARLPVMILMGFMALTICYFMTDQPLEAPRFTSFCMVCLLIAVVSESMGLLIGSVFSITNGSVVGPLTASPMLMLSIYGLGYGELIEGPMKFLMSLSYMRCGVTGLAVTMYGPGRAALKCNDLYCHYRRPGLLLRDLGMEGFTVQSQLVGLLCFFVLFRFLAYLAVRYRLTPEFDNRILKLLAKLLRHA